MKLHEDPQWKKFFIFDRCGLCGAEIAYVEDETGGTFAIDLETFPVRPKLASLTIPAYEYIPHGLICPEQKR